jgi:hypothetical protein
MNATKIFGLFIIGDVFKSDHNARQKNVRAETADKQNKADEHREG